VIARLVAGYVLDVASLAPSGHPGESLDSGGHERVAAARPSARCHPSGPLRRRLSKTIPCARCRPERNAPPGRSGSKIFPAAWPSTA